VRPWGFCGVIAPLQGLFRFGGATQGVALGWLIAAPLGLYIGPADAGRWVDANREIGVPGGWR
jgi:hypothetical protein